MLYYTTVPHETLELLKQIRKIKLFENLRLVGGTGLSLQIGHRTSADLDFFGKIEYDQLAIINELNKLGKVKIIGITENIYIYTLNNIKVDIVNYPYPWLYDKIVEDNLHIADLRDIAAMKLSAVTGRGTKKDFIDIYFLLKIYTITELLEFYEKKYADGSLFLVLKSLTYFDDADTDPQPKMLETIHWEDMKREISDKVKNIHQRKTQ